jgi:hypothetical protein
VPVSWAVNSFYGESNTQKSDTAIHGDIGILGRQGVDQVPSEYYLLLTRPEVINIISNLYLLFHLFLIF